MERSRAAAIARVNLGASDEQTFNFDKIAGFGGLMQRHRYKKRR